MYKEDEFPVDTARTRVNPPYLGEEDYQQYEEQGFFPPPGRASPIPMENLLSQTGFNVEEDKPILETGRRNLERFP